MNILKKIGLAAIIGAVAMTSQAFAGELTGKVDQVKNAKGTVNVFVFADAGAFENIQLDKAVKTVKVNAAKGSVTAKISGLKPGNYAFSVFHDENNNGKYDMQGMNPLEGYAYSNNVGKTDFAKFKDAQFKLDAAGSKSVSMIYFK